MNKPKIRFKGFEGEWKDSMLSDFSYSICSGRDTAHKGIYPLYGSTGIIGTTNKPSYNGAMLLVARVGANAGKLQIINEECGVSDNTLIIKPNGNISVSWLYYYLVHCNLNHLVYGSGQPLITGYMLKRIPILLGSKKECDEIASYFTALDTQIAASTSRLSSLKQIKAASLLNMFPQKGETVPRVRFKGFQGEWVRQRLGDISASFSGGTPAVSVSDYYGGNIPFIRSGEIHENRTQLYITQAGLNNSSAKIVEKGTILYALYGATSGDVGISKLRGAINQAILAIEPTKDIDNFFLAGFLQSYKNRIINELLQGGQGNLSGSLVKKILLAIPSLPEQRAIASYFTALDAQITLHRERLEKLKQIKAACLEKMFA